MTMPFEYHATDGVDFGRLILPLSETKAAHDLNKKPIGEDRFIAKEAKTNAGSLTCGSSKSG
jgi:hypothetical protein